MTSTTTTEGCLVITGKVGHGKSLPASTAAHITKEGIQVKVGQVWRDLDKRMYSGNRHCRVVAIADGKADMTHSTPDGRVIGSQRLVRVSIRRMHKSSTGWALAQDVQ